MRPPGVPPVPPPVHPDDELATDSSATMALDSTATPLSGQSTDPSQTPASSTSRDEKRLFTLGRRRLLLGAAASGLFVAGGGLLWRLGIHSHVPAPGLLALTAAERNTIEAIAEVFFPGDDNLPSGLDVNVVEGFDAYVASLPGRLGTLMRLLIQGIEWGAVVTSSRFERFSRMPLELREEVLDAWENSSLYARRSGFMSLKLAMGMSYYENDDVRSAIGWYVPCIDPSVEGAGEEWL